MNDPKGYKLKLDGISMHDHFLLGSESIRHAFVDSGTTFTYLPPDIWDSLMYHFDYFCNKTKNIKDKHGHKLYCPGDRFLTNSQGEQVMCFNYDASLYESGGPHTTRDFLMSYPILRFHAKDLDGKATTIDWYPSEYLYREPSGSMYCLAADKSKDPDQVLFGSTLMRQHQYIFDVENERIGITRANCSKDVELALTQADFVASGRTFGLQGALDASDSNIAQSAENLEYLSPCPHKGAKTFTKYIPRPWKASQPDD